MTEIRIVLDEDTTALRELRAACENCGKAAAFVAWLYCAEPAHGNQPVYKRLACGEVGTARIVSEPLR